MAYPPEINFFDFHFKKLLSFSLLRIGSLLIQASFDFLALCDAIKV
jgi:hypothetical protein